MVTLKLAASLDGRIATGTGESRWITGPRARAEVHLMRAQSDAVLVGAGTVRSDDPQLNVRDLGMEDRRPVRVVVSGALSLPREGYMAHTAREVPTWICHDPEADPGRRTAWDRARRRADRDPLQADGQLDLSAMMQRLGDRGLTRVLCEGGGRLAAALIEDDLVDESSATPRAWCSGPRRSPRSPGSRSRRCSWRPASGSSTPTPVGPDLRSRWRRRA